MNPTRKILHIIATNQVGGAEIFLAKLVGLLRGNLEHQIWYYVRNDGKPSVDTLWEENGVTNIEFKALPKLQTNPFSFVRKVWFFYKTFRRSPFKIVHCHSRSYIFPIQLAISLIPKKRCVVTIHSEYTETEVKRRPFFLIFHNLIGFGISKTITVSRHVRDQFALKYGKAVIYNGVELPELSDQGLEHRKPTLEEFGLTDANIVAICVANLKPGVKGYEYLIPAFLKFAATNPKFHLLVVGSGARDYLDGFFADVDSKKKNQIRFLGYRQDITKLLFASDFYVCPSEKDAMPLAVLEAMACCLPVLSTDAGGLPEIISHRQNGILVRKRSERALFQGLCEFSENQALWPRWGMRSREIVTERFNISTTAQKYKNLYDKLIGTGQADPG